MESAHPAHSATPDQAVGLPAAGLVVADTIRRWPTDATLSDIVEAHTAPETRDQVLVSVGDVYVPRQWWARVRPKPGRAITVALVPADPGTLAALGVFLAKALAVSLVSAGIGILANVLLNDSLADTGDQDLTIYSDESLHSGGAPTNRLARYEPYPSLFGRFRVTPQMGALPYRRTTGSELLLHLLFQFGYGPMQLSDPRIGTVPFSDFEGAVLNPRPLADGTDPPARYYTNAVFEETLSIELPTAGSNEAATGRRYTRRTKDTATWLSLLFTHAGLLRVNESGKPRPFSYALVIRYREVGTSTWLSPTDRPGFRVRGAGKPTVTGPGTVRYQAQSAEPFFSYWEWDPGPSAEYEVQVLRWDTEAPNNRPGGADTLNVIGDVGWVALQSYTAVDPINVPGIAKVDARIPANEQLNGQVDTFNMLAERMLPAYDPSDPEADPVTGFTPPRVTRECADAFVYVACGREIEVDGAPVFLESPNAQNVAPSRVDLERMAEWREWCQEQDPPLRFDHFYEQQVPSIEDVLRDIAKAGRARLVTRADGRYSVAIDRPATSLVPVQTFTERTCQWVSSVKSMPQLPHAVRVRFSNEEVEYAPDQVVEYAPGFSEANATLYEELDGRGMVQPRAVARWARFMVRVPRLRAESHQLRIGMASLESEVGDLCHFSHPILQVGLGSARVLSRVELAGTSVVAVVADARFLFQDGKEYAAEFRKQDDTYLTVDLVNPATGGADVETANLAFVTAVPIADAPSAEDDGDHLQFGERGLLSELVLVRSVASDGPFRARLGLLPYAPAVYDVDSEDIPPPQSSITVPSLPNRVVTPPRIVELVTDVRASQSTTGGDQIVRLILMVRPGSNDQVEAGWYQAAIRLDGGETDWALTELIPNSRPSIVFPDVELGRRYDVKVREVVNRAGLPGLASQWARVDGIVIEGKASPPPSPINFRTEPDLVLWDMPYTPDDLAGFEVRYQSGINVNWAAARPLHSGLLTASTYPLPDLGGGTVTLLVKAFDTSGNESSIPGLVVVNLGDPLEENIVLTQDEHALGFSGTITGGAVEGGTGDLVADNAADYWPDDTAPRWPADDANVYDTAGSELVYIFKFEPDAGDLPGRLSVEATIEGDASLIEYALGANRWPEDTENVWPPDDEPVWPTADEFVPLNGAVDLEAGAVEIRVSVLAGPTIGRISALVAKLDVPDVIERFSDVAISAGGTRIPPTKAFRQISNIKLSFQRGAGTGRSAAWVDKDPTLGPLIEVHDPAGLSVDGTVDAEFQGY